MGAYPAAEGVAREGPPAGAARASDRDPRAPAATAGADMTSTAREAPTFPMTARQHRQWAANARKRNRPSEAPRAARKGDRDHR